MRNDFDVAFAPADLPDGARLFPVSPGGGERLRRILAVVRPDIRFVDTADAAAYLLATGPDWLSDLALARATDPDRPAIVFPEIATSYYDFWSFPLELLSRSDDGRISVERGEFETFAAGMGSFFGVFANGTYLHNPERYRPIDRAPPVAASLLPRILDSLGDDFSRADLQAAFAGVPNRLWPHWLAGLFNGLEYMDYVHLDPGSVVFNCGVHGGGEIPYFLAALKGEGALIDADPLGHTYLSTFVRDAIAAFPGTVIERCAAIHNCVTSIDLPVEPGGMAAGNRIGETIPGLKTIRFPATTIDRTVEELGLARLDLIKMDIEGAEPLALAGAAKTIRAMRPQLAISIYHQPDHFYSIPLMLMDALKDYDFFVRNYHFISNETIFYAIPKERPRRARTARIGVALVDDVSSRSAFDHPVAAVQGAPKLIDPLRVG